MTPDEAVRALKTLDEYLRSCSRPDKKQVAAELHRIRDAVMPRTAGQVGKFTRADYEAAIAGMNALVEKLQKAAKTMNPQDPGRAELESEAEALQGLRGELSKSFQSISKLNI